ncbi:MAG TPA: NAD(P)H-dependent oxidoreductase subunit E, partial [Candidatus Kapabacteria bacterium]|nr:NAD(P)H-dependent oxidoreductase subunit E [Candidatus Kapabacteria bacterium]
MLKSLDELKEIAAKYNNCSNTLKKRVIVCAGTGCVANGSLKIYNELVQKINEAGIDCIVELKMEEHNENKILVSESGCQGFCQMGPLVTIEPDGIHYVKVKVEDVQEIVDHTLVLGKPIDKLLFVDPLTGEHCVHTKDIRFYNRQSRKVLGLCGHINPSDVYEYIAKNGYQAAFKALAEMTDKDICEEIAYAGLRGRGGGGFPTGRKWELTRIQKSDKK